MTSSTDIQVGEWTVQPLRGLLESESATAHIQPKAMDVLLCLIEHAPDVVERDVILEKVWGTRMVTDEPLTRCIGELRKALGDDRSMPRFIETIPKRGYRLLAAVTRPDVADLNYTAEPTHSVPDHSIAILPFTDLSVERNQKHLAEGIADDILTTLTRISDLKVAARTSSFSMFNRDLDEIRTTLGVRFVLEGSIKKIEDQIRVNVRVTDTDDGFQRFATSIDKRSEDLLVIQDEIVQGIFDCLPGMSADRPSTEWSNTKIPNVDAYDLYLKGRSAFNQRDMQNAVDYLQAAIDTGGNFASLYATYSAVLSLIPTYYLTDERTATYNMAKLFAQKALDIEPDCALALSTLGLISLAHRQWGEARRYLEEAVEKNPRETTARQWYGSLCLCMGDTDGASKQYEIAREIDPISPPLLRDIALVQYFDHRVEEAEKTLRLARSIITGTSQAYITNFMAMMMLEQGIYEIALDEMKQDIFLSALKHDELEAIISAIRYYRENGNPGQVPGHLEVKIPSAMMAARIFALSGNLNDAITNVRRGFHDADMWSPFSYVDPAFDEIRQTTAGELLFTRFEK